jgi:hypothetical protein
VQPGPDQCIEAAYRPIGPRRRQTISEQSQYWTNIKSIPPHLVRVVRDFFTKTITK